MLYAQADLQLAQGQQDEALTTANTALKQIKDRFDQGVEESAQTGQPDPASAFGIADTYWELLLLKADILQAKEDLDGALAAYDEYLETEKTAATVFAERGAVKEKLGDVEGAEADYRQTLLFIPDNNEALAGLKRMGVAR